MSKKVTCLLTYAAALVVCVLLFAVRLTGEPVHMILGLAAIIVMMVHGIRKGNRLKYVPASWRVVDILLICATAIVLVTGMIIHPMKDVMLVLILHKLSSVVMVLGCIVHLIQHRK